MIKIQKSRLLNLFLSFYFLFFYGWLQFHHGHTAQDYLNPDDSACRVIVAGAHCHSSEADFPLFENHRITVKHKIECLLCTFTHWLFPCSSADESVFILKVQKLGRLPSESVLCKNAHINYRLRAPPVHFLSS